MQPPVSLSLSARLPLGPLINLFPPLSASFVLPSDNTPRRRCQASRDQFARESAGNGVLARGKSVPRAIIRFETTNDRGDAFFRAASTIPLPSPIGGDINYRWIFSRDAPRSREGGLISSFRRREHSLSLSLSAISLLRTGAEISGSPVRLNP